MLSKEEEKVQDLVEMHSTAQGTMIVRVKVGSFFFGAQQISQLRIYESVYDKVPKLQILVSAMNSDLSLGSSIINDNDLIEIYYYLDEEDKTTKPMHFRVTSHKIIADSTMSTFAVQIIGILDVQDFYEVNTMGFTGSSSQIIKQLATKLGLGSNVDVAVESNDNMNWLMCNQSGIEFLDHIEKRALLSDPTDALCLYFTRYGKLHYKSLLQSAQTQAKWNFLYLLDPKINEEIGPAEPTNIAIDSVEVINVSGLLNKYISYGVSVNMYDDETNLKSPNTHRHNYGITKTTQTNINNEFKDSISSNFYAGRQSVNVFGGMPARQILNEYYRVHYFTSFIEVSIQLVNQFKKFRDTPLMPLDKINVSLKNNSIDENIRYSGEYMVLSILYCLDDRTNSYLKVLLGRSGDNLSNDIYSDTAVKNITNPR